MLFDITLGYDLIDILQLQQHIKAYNNRLGTIVDGCAYEEITRKITIVFNETYQMLLTQDIEDISAAVSTYTNPPISQEFRIVNTGLQKMEVMSSDFRSVFEYEYQMEPRWRMKRFHIKTLAILNQNTSDLSYTIRIVNISTNQVIGSETFTSSEISENIVDIDDNTIFNETQTLEIQIKTDSPGVLSILSGHIKYNCDV